MSGKYRVRTGTQSIEYALNNQHYDELPVKPDNGK